jgi:hypothetical protein
MASSDYALCNNCGRKAFYDAVIDDPHYVATYNPRVAKEWKPVGFAVLCEFCNETHEIVIRQRAALTATDATTKIPDSDAPRKP